MNKTRNLTIQCVAVFVMFLGVWWWVGRKYEKTHPKEIAGWKPIANPVKIYYGKWNKEGYLEVMGK